MRTIEWNPELTSGDQIRSLCLDALETGFLVVRFVEVGSGEPLPWTELEPWTRARAVTVADVGCNLTAPALEVAACSDLVYLREGATLRLPSVEDPPSGGLVWAFGRAGRPALDRLLLEGGPLTGGEAVDLGVARSVVGPRADLPLPDRPSTAALTSARDLMRCRTAGTAGLALELAAFRLLFAAGEPNEGAKAFLERREPVFGRK